MDQPTNDELGPQKKKVHPLLLLSLLLAGTAAAFWLAKALPPSAMLALAAAALALAAGALLWRLWGHW